MLDFINIPTSCKRYPKPSRIGLSQEPYSLVRVWIKGIPFPFKKMVLTKLTSIPWVTYPWARYLIYVCERFEKLIPASLKQFYSNLRGLICFSNFHMIHCTLQLFNLNSPHCTLLVTSINAITPLIFNIHQLFHMLLLDFFSIIHLLSPPHFHL